MSTIANENISEQELILSLAEYIKRVHLGQLNHLLLALSASHFFYLNPKFNEFNNHDLFILISIYGHIEGLFIKSEKIYHVPFFLKMFLTKQGGHIPLIEIFEFYELYPDLMEFLPVNGIENFVNKYKEKYDLYLDKKKDLLYGFLPIIKEENINSILNENLEKKYSDKKETEPKPKIKYIQPSNKMKINKSKWFSKKEDYEVFNGESPPGASNNFQRFVSPLEKYCIPKKFMGYLQHTQKNINNYGLQNNAKSLLNTKISYSQFRVEENQTSLSNNITDFLNLLIDLLFVEEVQMLYDMSTYDLEKVYIKKEKNLYRLDVPGLAEKRPSILRNDQIILENTRPRKTIRSPVWFVNLDHVLLSLPYDMIAHDYIVDVHFQFTRTPLRLMHRALKTSKSIRAISKILDPIIKDEFVKIMQKETEEIALSKNLNEMQKNAIKMILNFNPKTCNHPIIIFGPPGTGKTVTIVEGMINILKKFPKSRILACAPSNDAADLICLRLLEAQNIFESKKNLKKKKILRVVALMRDPKSIPDLIKKSCDAKYVDGAFVLPKAEEILSYDIVVTTSSSAGYLVSMGLNEEFTHIFVDEAGEAMIPEIMIPISLKSENTSIILAGDPKQLGPIIRSPVALEYGLDVSLIERLIQERLNGLHKENPSLSDMLKVGIVHLVDNYRAHNKIMDIYSEIFYEGRLNCKTDPAEANKMLKWDKLRNPLIPVLFQHVEGVEGRDQNSPSWFNQTEIDKVKEIILDILQKKLANSNDIGIISPYRKQCDKIKQMLHSLDQENDKLYQMNKIKVGTTELFQGDEREIMILTCVRSQSKHLEHDFKFNLGFISNPKRINVAISRAKSLLIILGNAELLNTDENFRKILKKINQMQCYEGPKLEIMSKTSRILDDNENDAEFEDYDECEDKEWKENEAL